ncbi:GNAT family N-acetyltransferase [Pusillimonas sp. MFBS29]|uniref:GNAT family N-acetyltransferase n=1 Tax=Pusillimonas sp. MFBS29 TaxID=2886690 RepID=UPI001D0F6FAA|nr:GNAT family N-acetyltransferase [Pusillimonas sp. MFBS29]MCC2596923.1 GNAT family N-acetyltransferase [Pusillimonas sp. MFBS29]
MEIRRFRVEDASALFQVFLSSIHDIASRDYTAAQVEAWAQADRAPEVWASRMRELQPFVAEAKGKIIGYADIQPNGYIDHFFVSGAQSRQGVGTLLMSRIHDEARLLGISQLTADVSTSAEPFFLHHGFQVVERRFPIRRGVMLQNSLMRKDLHRKP